MCFIHNGSFETNLLVINFSNLITVPAMYIDSYYIGNQIALMYAWNGIKFFSGFFH